MIQLELYEMNYYFCGFYRCVNSGESLTNLTQSPSGFTQFVSDSSLHIDKIHKNKIHTYNNREKQLGMAVNIILKHTTACLKQIRSGQKLGHFPT